jgi:hypothetical protein
MPPTKKPPVPPSKLPANRHGDDRCALCGGPFYRVHPNTLPLCVKHYWRSRRRGWEWDPAPELSSMTQSQADEAKRLLAAGFTRVRIAELLGLSQSTVIGFFRRGGSYSNEPRRTPKPRRKPKL